jgi:hypothetical protein
MKANGKRIGRLEGKLDDLVAQVENYEAHEAQNPVFDHRRWEKLNNLRVRLGAAQLAAKEVLDDINRPQ